MCSINSKFKFFYLKIYFNSVIYAQKADDYDTDNKASKQRDIRV